MSRSISDKFLKELKKSVLLKVVRQDTTLDLEFRGDHVEVYYRGCAIMNVYQDSIIELADNKYFENNDLAKKLEHLKPVDPKVEMSLFDYIMLAKTAVDLYDKKEMRETDARQRIVYENNRSGVANDTDFFVIDIEYQNNAGKKFDIVALRWKSNGRVRQANNVKNIGLTIFELKYGMDSIGSSKDKDASISQHMKDYRNFIKPQNSTENIPEFKRDMLRVFEQKCELQLIKFGDNGNENWRNFKHFDIDEVKLNFGYIFANYKKSSRRIKLELKKFKEDFVYMESSYMGYGLYLSDMHKRKDLERELFAQNNAENNPEKENK